MSGGIKEVSPKPLVRAAVALVETRTRVFRIQVRINIVKQARPVGKCSLLNRVSNNSEVDLISHPVATAERFFRDKGSRSFKLKIEIICVYFDFQFVWII
jgi:hypothetical protein